MAKFIQTVVFLITVIHSKSEVYDNEPDLDVKLPTKSIS
jgi:hypothetical protein